MIPLNIFQTWHTKLLPERMLHAIMEVKRNNPEFKHYLFDDKECYEFIKKYFGSVVSMAYSSLIPSAYKADLWRYCVLFIHGGIYLDVKYTNVDKIKLIQLTKKEHWCLDANDKDVYNAILVCKPQNEILLKVIKQIVENVKNKFYGDSFLEPTGPALLSKYFTEEEKKEFELKHIFNSENGNTKKFILFNKQHILTSYTGYFIDNKRKHYSNLWLEKKIYR
jgi:mannosyltransferase OCH1-like enzyme